jgi:hypothetical protein
MRATRHATQRYSELTNCSNTFSVKTPHSYYQLSGAAQKHGRTAIGYPRMHIYLTLSSEHERRVLCISRISLIGLILCKRCRLPCSFFILVQITSDAFCIDRRNTAIFGARNTIVIRNTDPVTQFYGSMNYFFSLSRITGR